MAFMTTAPAESRSPDLRATRPSSRQAIPGTGNGHVRMVAVAVCIALFALHPALAVNVAEDKGCSDKVSTMDIVQCTAARTKLWDARLNAAYAALQKFVDPAQRKPLQDAQRVWIRYRDANCAFYGAGEGTITQIREAECRMTMTRDRTLEFEAAAKP